MKRYFRSLILMVIFGLLLPGRAVFARSEDNASSTTTRTDSLPLSAAVANSVSMQTIQAPPYQVIDTVNVGVRPRAVAFSPDSTLAYISHEGEATIKIIQTSSHSIVDTIVIGETIPGYNLMGMDITPGGQYLYVVWRGKEVVVPVRLSDNTVLPEIPVQINPIAISITPDGQYAYIAGNGGVDVLSIAANVIVGHINFPIGAYPYAIHVSPNGTQAYVNDNPGNKVYIIDTSTNTIIDSINVNREPHHDIEVSPDGNMVYTSASLDGTVDAIRLADKHVDHIYVGGGVSGIAVSPDGQYLFSSSYGTNKVSVIKTADNSIIQQIQVGSRPDGIIDMSPNGYYLYVPNTESNNVSVISNLTTITAQPDTLPADGVSLSTITLFNAQPGHRVQMFSSRRSVDTFANASGTVNSSGQFTTTIRSSTVGTAIITAKDLTTGKTFAASTSVTFTPVSGGTQPPPPNQGDVKIIDIKFEHPLDARYLQGIPVRNRVEVYVDWKGYQPGYIKFDLNGHVTAKPAGSYGASVEYDMGRDLQVGSNLLKITAYNAQGDHSNSMPFAPYLIDAPSWLLAMIENGAIGPLRLVGSTTGKEYKTYFKFPPMSLLDLGIPNFGPTGTKSNISFLISGDLILPVKCNDPLKMEIMGGVDAKIRWVSIELGGELKGTGSIIAQAIQCKIPTAQGNIRIDLKVWGKKGWPLISLISDIIAPGSGIGWETFLFDVGLDPAFLLGEVYVQGDMHGFLESGVKTIVSSPYLEWDGLRVGIGPGIEFGYRLDVIAAEFRAYAGGGGTLELYNPNTLRELGGLRPDKVTFRGEAGIELRWFGFTKEWIEFIEWNYPPEDHFINILGSTATRGTSSPITHPHLTPLSQHYRNRSKHFRKT